MWHSTGLLTAHSLVESSRGKTYEGERRIACLQGGVLGGARREPQRWGFGVECRRQRPLSLDGARRWQRSNIASGRKLRGWGNDTQIGRIISKSSTTPPFNICHLSFAPRSLLLSFFSMLLYVVLSTLCSMPSLSVLVVLAC